MIPMTPAIQNDWFFALLLPAAMFTLLLMYVLNMQNEYDG